MPIMQESGDMCVLCVCVYQQYLLLYPYPVPFFIWPLPMVCDVERREKEKQYIKPGISLGWEGEAFVCPLTRSVNFVNFGGVGNFL